MKLCRGRRPVPYAEININPYTNLLTSSESRVKVSQRLNELCEWERECGRADASSGKKKRTPKRPL